MKTQFEWQTEDETWDPLPPEPPSPIRKWGWRSLAVLALLVAAAGLTLYRQAIQRIDTTTAESTADLLSSYNVQQRAIAEQDAELFATVLSGRDLRWTETQKALFAAGLLVDRTPFGLTAVATDFILDPETVADTAVAIELSPDYNAATLTLPRSYTLQTAAGITETVVLAQTAVFRRGSQRWLYAPPERDFWGEWQTTTGDRLTLIYTDREADLALRLAADLEAALATACATLPMINCASSQMTQLRLGTDSDLLLAAQTDQTFMQTPGRLELPTPTLLGLPTDDDSYQALVGMYARPLLINAITDIVGWECCRRMPMYQALMDYQLAQLGYGRWPVTAHDYQRLLLEGYGSRDLLTVWSETVFNYSEDPSGWLVYTAVDFLLQREPNQNAAAMMRQLTLQSTLAEWVAALHGGGIDNRSSIIADFEQEWLDYAYNQSQTLVLPQPLPAQDILALCGDVEMSEEVALYRYLARSGEWQQQLELPFSFINPLPGDRGLVVQSLAYSQDIDGNHVMLWQDGTLTMLSDAPLSISLGQSDPSGRYLLAFTSDGLDAPNALDLELFDLNSCTSEGCAAHSVAGLPVWSPTGDQAILTRDALLESTPLIQAQGRIFMFNVGGSAQSWELVLTDRRLQPQQDAPIGFGYAPFWIDADRFGYLREGDDGQSELVVAALPDAVPQVVVGKGDLMTAVTEDDRPATLFLGYALANPANPNQLLLTAFDDNERDAYIFSYDMREDDLVLRQVLGYEYEHSFEISPNGRYFVATGKRWSPRSDLIDLVTVIQDLVTNRTTELLTPPPPTFLPMPAHDWSADGRWLLTNINERFFGLVAPEFEYQQLLRHDLGKCLAVLWAEPLP